MCRLEQLGVVETIVPSSVAASYRLYLPRRLFSLFLKTSLCNVFFVCLFFFVLFVLLSFPLLFFVL